jgi:hypothetical protein
MLATLSDPDTLRLLSAIVGARLQASPAEAPPHADILAALTDTFGSPATAAEPTDGDLARAALALAADDPATAEHLEGMIELGPPPTMGAETIVLALTAALVILQTEVTFERTSTGKYRVKLHKRAASDALLKSLAQVVMRALTRLPGGGDRSAHRLPE